MRWRKIAEDLSVTVLVDVGIFIDRIIFQRFDGPEQEAYAEGILVLSIDAFVESQIPAVALAPQHLTRKAHHDLVWDDSPRSEERRVGKECVSTCRYRGSPTP